MLPVILAAVGGYLVYDSLKSKKFADGGTMDDGGMMAKGGELNEYLYNFKGGGWNSISAHNKAEAINLAKARHRNWNKSKLYAQPKLEVDESTFRIKTEKDYKNLMSGFYADGGMMADGGITDVKQGDKVDLSTISQSLNSNLELDFNNDDLIALKSRLISGQQKGSYIRTSPDGGEIKFEDGTTFEVLKKDGKINVLKTSKKSKSKRKVVGGQSDEELYEALADMGYDFGEMGSEDFDEDGFSETAVNLGYRYDEKKKLWNNNNMDDGGMMARGGRTKAEITADKRYKALKAGKRVSEDGNVYYESRANRSDVSRRDKLADGGMTDSKISDFKKRVKERYGKDGMYAENFSPEPTSKEIDKAVTMFLDWTDSKQKKFNPKDTENVEIVGDLMLYNRGEAFYNLGHEKIVKEVLKSVRR